MRRILVMLSLIFSATIMAVACGKEPAPEPEPISPIVSLEALELVVEGDEGEHALNYNVLNPVADAVLSAECDAEWLTVDVDAAKVRVAVTKNEARLPREATILLSYPKCKDVELRVVQNEYTRRFELFPMHEEADIPYRIPAVTVTMDGSLVAVADYRHSRYDIGVADFGRIDLHMRRSTDNGVTWGPIEVIIEGKGSASEDFMNVGYGDPCIVADCESQRVLLMSCAGNVSYQAGTRDRHQNMARFYSEDGGLSWSAPTDIAESIYSKFDECSFGPVNAMFVASGRIMQSRQVKVDDYYRLYCAVLVRDKYNSPKNFVLYSDNFGDSWEVLGGVAKAPLGGNCDEPKVEELPDGSVLLSSRWMGGRYFNIYSFANVATAEGRWGSASFSSRSNDGVSAVDNSTNGEVMLVKALRKADGAEVDLLLQSVPLGPGRTNVGIYYKALESASDYSAASVISRGWEGVCQVTTLGSAYSTMAWQHDGRLAFLWEEATYCSDKSGGYTIVYDSFSLEKITGGKYSFRE